MNSEKGLLPKYNVKKANGTPVDPNAKYFVLRYDEGQKDENHRIACIKALSAYADAIEPHIPELAKDLKKIVAESGIKQP